MAGFRDVLIHDYQLVNINRVWLVIENNLPILKQKVNDLLSDNELILFDKKKPSLKRAKILINN